MRALEFIQRNSTRDLKVSDVVRHLGVSRRLASLRFQEPFDRVARSDGNVQRVDVGLVAGPVRDERNLGSGPCRRLGRPPPREPPAYNQHILQPLTPNYYPLTTTH